MIQGQHDLVLMWPQAPPTPVYYERHFHRCLWLRLQPQTLPVAQAMGQRSPIDKRVLAVGSFALIRASCLLTDRSHQWYPSSRIVRSALAGGDPTVASRAQRLAKPAVTQTGRVRLPPRPPSSPAGVPTCGQKGLLADPREAATFLFNPALVLL